MLAAALLIIKVRRFMSISPIVIRVYSMVKEKIALNRKGRKMAVRNRHDPPKSLTLGVKGNPAGTVLGVLIFLSG
jgi:hypothetical protein